MAHRLIRVIEKGCPECHSSLTRNTLSCEPLGEEFGVHQDTCHNPQCHYTDIHSDNPHLQDPAQLFEFYRNI